MVAGFAAGADAVLAASIFHYGRHSVGEVKAVLDAAGVPVRLSGARRRGGGRKPGTSG
jgi:cyclase